MWDYLDLHCHLSTLVEAEQQAQILHDARVAVLDVSVGPRCVQTCKPSQPHASNVVDAHGAHPWWVSTASPSELENALICCSQQRYIGEVGLDFSQRWAHGATKQIQAFERLIKMCADHPIKGRVLSIHAVASASCVLDILDTYDFTHHAACIFHWFSGSSHDLMRARQAGCYFSCGERMLATKKGRAYAQQIPADRLLIETDAVQNPQVLWNAQTIIQSLKRSCATLAELRQTPQEQLRQTIAQQSAELLGLTE